MILIELQYNGIEIGREEEKIIQEKIRAKERNEQDLKLKSIILNLKSKGMDKNATLIAMLHSCASF
jgi:hypothetical protein